MRWSPLLGAVTVALGLACGGDLALPELPLPEPGDPEPEEEADERQHLQALVATSGAAQAQAAIDGDPDTSWAPSGDPDGEGLLFRFEERQEVSEVRLVPCGEATFSAELYADGQLIDELEISGELRHDVSSVGQLRSLFVKLEGAGACVSEIALISGEAPIAFQGPRRVEAQLQVSSTLEPEAAYHASYLFDGRTHFGWVEGAKGLGKGEQITLSFASPQQITAIEIHNGYQRSADHFDKNGRVAALELVAGDRTLTLQLDDAMGPQTLEIDPPLSAQELSLRLAEVTAGSRYEDTVISELRFFDAQGPFTVVPDTGGSLSDALRDEIAGKPLEGMVGKMYRQVCGEPRELKLRADHSFVRYETRSEGSETRIEIFDGAWVPEGGSAAKLYGRRHVTTTDWSPYGSGEQQSTQVSGGTVELATMGAMGRDKMQKLIKDWKRGGASDRIGCLLTNGRPDPKKIRPLMNKDTLIVQGKAITDFMVHDPG